MQELRCSSGGPRGGNREGKETNMAFSLQSSLAGSLILPGHHRRERPRGQSGLFWISLRGIYREALGRRGCQTQEKQESDIPNSRPYSGPEQDLDQKIEKS